MVWIITSQRYLTFRFDWKKYGKNSVIVFPLPRFSSTIQSEQVQCYNYQNYWGEDKTWTRGPWTPTLDHVHMDHFHIDRVHGPPVMDRVHGQFLYLMPKCCLFQWFFFRTGKLCFGGKRFDSDQMWLFVAYFILRGRETHIDFLPLFRCKALHCGWLISPKCLLDLIILSHFLLAR